MTMEERMPSGSGSCGGTIADCRGKQIPVSQRTRHGNDNSLCELFAEAAALWLGKRGSK